MDKAMEIISRDGMEGLTIARLSRRIGVSDGAIYRHFDSKLSIIKEILNDLFYQVSEQMMDEVSKDEAVRDKLERITSQLYRMFEQQPAYISLLFSEEYFFSDDDIFYLMHTIVNSMQLYMRQILVQGIEKKELKGNLNSQYMSLLIMGAMRITVLNWRLKRNRNGLEKTGVSLINSVIELMEN